MNFKNIIKTVDHWGHIFIDSLIVANFAEAVLTTYPWFCEMFDKEIAWFDNFSIKVFCIEIIVRIIFGGKDFWIGRNYRWNWFDLIITALTVVTSNGFFSSVRMLRLFRLLRLLRMFSVFKGLRALVSGLLSAIPKIGWLVMLWGAIITMYSVIGCHLFGEDFPQWFGSLEATMYTMFQVMTLESWSMGISRPVMELYPFAALYFVSYICITAFTLLNALTGVMVTSMTEVDHNDHSDEHTNIDKDNSVADTANNEISNHNSNKIDELNKKIDILIGQIESMQSKIDKMESDNKSQDPIK